MKGKKSDENGEKTVSGEKDETVLIIDTVSFDSLHA